MPRPKRARRAPPVKEPKPTAPAATTTEKRDDDGGEHNEDNQRGRTRARARATRSTAARSGLSEEDALRAARQSRDAALDRLANEDPTITSGPEDDDNNINNNKNSGSSKRERVSVERPQRAMETPLARRDTSGLDLADDSMFGDLGDSFADGEVPEAPPSGASSSATLSHLKTRPRSRQSSIIGRNDPPIRPSSRGGNTPGVSSSFNIGIFRRRAREPSILGISRRGPRSQTGSATSSRVGSRAGSVVRDSELEMDSEGDVVLPEAESTPSKSRRQSRKSQNHHHHHQQQQQQQQQQQEEDKQPSPSPSPPPSPSPDPRRRSTRKRNREDAAPSESEARPARVSRMEANGGLVIDSDSELSDLPSSPPRASFAGARAVTPMNMDEINAPPASSDSEVDNNVTWPDIHTLAKKRRRPSVTTPAHDNFSDISTPPSLTHSPNNLASAAATKARSAAKQQQQRHRRQSPKVTTADLASLLPKRTYKKRNREDDFDMDSDSGANSSQGEQEEDTRSRRPQPRRGRGRGRKGPPSTSRAAAALSSTSTALKSKRATESAGRTRRSARTAHKTFRSGEGKENDTAEDHDDDDDENAEEEEEEEEEGGGEEQQHEKSHFQPLPDDTFDESALVPDVQNTEELLRAAQKFSEVDQWELSYEEMVEPPSPQGAR
ncbi:hypothetical protein E4U16_004439 [Claviceps sp. LM84 group G4]|nr:hypothetical protein E4U16_004439 [Claviceps sp. LM84 group G4]KAG6082633.1 hypothetical protein E4U33_005504 [Claviceps sp. LM78 group G4]